MATPTEHDFPLATHEFTPADGVGSPDGDAGTVDRDSYTEAGSDDSGGMYLPQGALIAIIVVAAVIAVVGGTSRLPHTSGTLVLTDRLLISEHGHSLLRRQEARVEDAREVPPVRPQGRQRPHASPQRVPEGGQELGAKGE